MTEPAAKTATIMVDDRRIELPITVGTHGERAIDIQALRQQTGCITLDEGFRSTGSCRSSVAYIDGEKGILRYRGIPIEQLAEHSTFIETAWLLIWGELPNDQQLRHFRHLLTEHELIHEGLHHHYDGFPSTAPPMAILSAMINSVSCYHTDIMEMESPETFEAAAARLLSKVRTIAAAAYKASVGEPLVYPNPENDYVRNFLHMMFSIPYRAYDPPQEIVRALGLFFLLHADHEQNCSTSTVRMVASSGANLFASCAAGVCALWGWRHGGANVAVIKMLEELNRAQMSVKEYLERVKKREVKLMGFGHRIYKNYDPRARILASQAETVLRVLNVHDPLLDIAKELEGEALSDDYFRERNLYPNVDFYSGIILRAMGIPVNMFTVMFAIGRMPGWIAHYKETYDRPELGIARPRQLYVGQDVRDYRKMGERG
jgi:citrate synthase